MSNFSGLLGMLAMNLTFAQSPPPSESSAGGTAEAKSSVIDIFKGQLGLTDSWKVLYSSLLSLIKKSFDFTTLLKSEKADEKEGDLTGSTGKESYRAKKAYRFIAIVAYVSCVWAIRRAQRKALLEGTENVLKNRSL